MRLAHGRASDSRGQQAFPFLMNKSIAVECVLAGIPLVLLSVSGNLKRMLKYAAFFLALLLIQLFIVPRLPVTFGGIVYMFAVYIRKLLPCFMLGSFLIATTSVSKFLAAITKLRLSKGLTIALAITLRYFPTMREEWASIRDAMALRGISASAAGLISHPIQTMEYVYVPPACFCFQNFGRDHAGSDYKRHRAHR